MISILSINADCDSLFTPEALEIIREILGYFRIIAPILLIVFIALDYGAAVINNDNDALMKANGRVVGRAIGVILLFFVPTIVKFALDITSFSQYSSDYMCENASGTAAKYVITYTPKETKKSSTSKVDSSKVDNPKDVNNDSNVDSKVGNKANPSTAVCLKDQPGLRDKYQSELESKVKAAGGDTRAGVVAAAIYLSSEIGIKIPYFPGGCHSMSCLNKGIVETTGCQKTVVHNASKWPATLPDGLDCSGFTFWAYGVAFGQRAYISSEIHNPANASATVVKSGKKVTFRLETVPINKNNYEFIIATLQPGDLVGSDGHIGMVIDTSNLSRNGTYTVAHASSQHMQLSVENYKLGDSKWNRFVLMRKFFLRYDCLIKDNQTACTNFECVNSDNCNSFGLKY